MLNRAGRFLRAWLLLSVLAVSISFSASSRSEAAFSDNADAIETAANSVFMLEVYSSRNQQIAIGSGFVAFDSSIMVTNYHVIEGGAYVVAVSDDNERFLIDKKCIVDSRKDIAILKYDRGSLALPLPLDSEGNLKRAQKVVAIGSPAGLMNTISIGNISAFYTKDGKDWIQFTAPISSGSSGGALLDNEGRVIGITTATYASTQNINMAVRIRDVIQLYNRWDRRTVSAMGNMKASPAPAAAAGSAGSTSRNVVWVTASGRKYHSNPNCSSMRNPIEMDLMEAIGREYTPCGKCFK